MPQVVLVDRQNRKIGVEEKLVAHKKGLLHRAISIFIFNSKGELLLQQRAKNKYHSAGLWSNTVCSHPAPGESFAHAAHRRLEEEMGFDCKLKKLYCFIYQTEFDNGLSENEYDCVFVGEFNGQPKPNPVEVAAYRWQNLDDLKQDILKHGDIYTFWLKLALEQVATDHMRTIVKS